MMHADDDDIMPLRSPVNRDVETLQAYSRYLFTFVYVNTYVRHVGFVKNLI